KGEGLASCVPIYVDTIPEVDPQTQLSSTGNQAISSTMTEQQTVDNSTIAGWIMLFSELYLAYKLAKSKEYQIILLDRSLSGTLSSLMYDTSKRPLWKQQCAICTVDIDNAKLDDPELAYGRYHLAADGSLPARGDYLRYAAILLLEKSEKPLTVAEIAARLNCTADDKLKRLSRYLKQTVDAGFLHASDE